MADHTSTIIQAFMAGQQAKQSREALKQREKESEDLRKYRDEQLKLQREHNKAVSDRADADLELRRIQARMSRGNDLRSQISQGLLRVPGASSEGAPINVDDSQLPVPIEGTLDVPGIERIAPEYIDPESGIKISNYVLPEELGATKAAIMDQLMGSEANRAFLLSRATTEGQMPKIDAQIEAEQAARTNQQAFTATQKEEDRQNRLEVARIRKDTALARINQQNVIDPNRRDPLAIARDVAEIENSTITLEDLAKRVPNQQARQKLIDHATSQGIKIFKDQDIESFKGISQLASVVNMYDEIAKMQEEVTKFDFNVIEKGKLALQLREKMKAANALLASVVQIRTNQPASRISDMDIEIVKGGEPTYIAAFMKMNAEKINKIKSEINLAIKDLETGAKDSQVQQIRNRYEYPTYSKSWQPQYLTEQDETLDNSLDTSNISFNTREDGTVVVEVP